MIGLSGGLLRLCDGPRQGRPQFMRGIGGKTAFSVNGRLCFGRWEVSDGLKQAAVVEPIDLLERDGFSWNQDSRKTRSSPCERQRFPIPS